MKRLVRFNFYRVTFHGSGQSPRAVLDDIWQLPEADRCKQVQNYHTYLNAYHPGRQAALGSITKLRMSGIPGKGNVKGQSWDLGLTDEEGVTEETCFLYHYKTQVMVVQSTQYGVRETALSGYLGAFAHAHEYPYFDPIPNIAKVEELTGEDIQAVTAFDLTLAPMVGAPTLPEESRMPSDTIQRLQRELNNPRLRLMISTGRSWRDATLPPKRVKKMATNLLTGGRVKTLRISVKTTDDELRILDLMKGKLSYVAEINQRTRRLSLQELNGVLRDAWSAHGAQLEEAYVDEDGGAAD